MTGLVQRPHDEPRRAIKVNLAHEAGIWKLGAESSTEHVGSVGDVTDQIAKDPAEGGFPGGVSGRARLGVLGPDDVETGAERDVAHLLTRLEVLVNRQLLHPEPRLRALGGCFRRIEGQNGLVHGIMRCGRIGGSSRPGPRKPARPLPG